MTHRKLTLSPCTVSLGDLGIFLGLPACGLYKIISLSSVHSIKLQHLFYTLGRPQHKFEGPSSPSTGHAATLLGRSAPSKTCGIVGTPCAHSWHPQQPYQREMLEVERSHTGSRNSADSWRYHQELEGHQCSRKYDLHDLPNHVHGPHLHLHDLSNHQGR